VLEPLAVHRPGSVAEASQLLRVLGDDAAIYAGGTELLVVMKERLAHFGHLIDIKAIPGLNGIALDGERRELRIGALATHRDVERSPLVRETIPALAVLEAKVANVRVRAAGTIGGNLCFAEPHSDPAILLTALGTRLNLASSEEAREIELAAFFTGVMETARRHDEILTAITIPCAEADVGVAYERFKLHERPTAAVAAVVNVDDGAMTDARIVVGCVGERPQRLPHTERLLRWLPVVPASAAAAADVIHEEVEIAASPFESDVYLRQLARTLGRRAIAAAMERAGGGEGRRHAA
jgi:carbon-monoxide dehydrogenase medium subunit